MSLATLNNPILVAAAGVSGYALLPLFEKLAVNGSIPWTVLKTANALSYAINVIATSRPGRIDGQSQTTDTSNASAAATSSKNGIDTGNEMESLSPGKKGRTLVSPAGWAFAIWGPIFLGELVFVVAQLVLPETSPIAPLVKKITAPFVMAQVFQTLWTAAFRPKYSGNLMFISTALLAGTSYSLSKAHAAIVATPKLYNFMQYFIFFLPIGLHFGWTTAAALVNVNGAVAMKPSASPQIVRWLGHVSVVAASAAGIYISLHRSAPVYGGVIAWALFAVADGMKQRVDKTSKEDPNRVGVYGARMQQRLSSLGAWANATASLAAALSLFVLQPRNHAGTAP